MDMSQAFSKPSTVSQDAVRLAMVQMVMHEPGGGARLPESQETSTNPHGPNTLRKRVAECLQDSPRPMNRNQLRDATGGQINRLDRALRTLVEAGDITAVERTEMGRRIRYYSAAKVQS